MPHRDYLVETLQPHIITFVFEKLQIPQQFSKDIVYFFTNSLKSSTIQFLSFLNSIGLHFSRWYISTVTIVASLHCLAYISHIEF